MGDKMDGQLEYDDRGFRCYWDAEEEEWIASPQWATKRFLTLLESLPTFEGWDDEADDD